MLFQVHISRPPVPLEFDKPFPHRISTYWVVASSMDEAVLQAQEQIKNDPKAYVQMAVLMAPNDNSQLIVVDDAAV